MGNDMAALIDDGRVTPIAEVNVASQLFDVGNVQLGQQHRLDVPALIGDRLRHENRGLVGQRAVAHAGQTGPALFERIEKDMVPGEEAALPGGNGRQGRGIDEFSVTGEQRQVAKVGQDGTGVLQQIDDFAVGRMFAQPVGQHGQHGLVILHVQLQGRGQVHGQQPMLFVDFAPGVVPRGMIETNAEQGQRHQGHQHEGTQQQLVQGPSQQTAGKAGLSHEVLGLQTITDRKRKCGRDLSAG